MPKKVLVFGPCGNVGRFLLPLLDEFEVHVACHNSIPSTQTRFVSHKVDLMDEESISEALNAAAPAAIVFMTPTIAGTTPMIHNFVSAAKSYSGPLEVIAYISEGDIDEFLETKLTCYDGVMDNYDLVMKRSGLPVCRLEPTGFYQNFVNFYSVLDVLRKAGRSPGVLATGVQGTTELAWVDAFDIAHATVSVLRDPAAHRGQHYRLASMEGFVALLNKHHRTQLTYSRTPHDVLEKMFLEKGLSDRLAADRALAFSSYHEKHFPVLSADPQGPMALLLGRPATTLSGYLQREHAMYVEAIEANS